MVTCHLLLCGLLVPFVWTAPPPSKAVIEHGSSPGDQELDTFSPGPESETSEETIGGEIIVVLPCKELDFRYPKQGQRTCTPLKRRIRNAATWPRLFQIGAGLAAYSAGAGIGSEVLHDPLAIAEGVLNLPVIVVQVTLMMTEIVLYDDKVWRFNPMAVASLVEHISIITATYYLLSSMSVGVLFGLKHFPHSVELVSNYAGAAAFHMGLVGLHAVQIAVLKWDKFMAFIKRKTLLTQAYTTGKLPLLRKDPERTEAFLKGKGWQQGSQQIPLDLHLRDMLQQARNMHRCLAQPDPLAMVDLNTCLSLSEAQLSELSDFNPTSVGRGYDHSHNPWHLIRPYLTRSHAHPQGYTHVHNDLQDLQEVPDDAAGPSGQSSAHDVRMQGTHVHTVDVDESSSHSHNVDSRPGNLHAHTSHVDRVDAYGEQQIGDDHEVHAHAPGHCPECHGDHEDHGDHGDNGDHGDHEDHGHGGCQGCSGHEHGVAAILADIISHSISLPLYFIAWVLHSAHLLISDLAIAWIAQMSTIVLLACLFSSATSTAQKKWPQIGYGENKARLSTLQSRVEQLLLPDSDFADFRDHVKLIKCDMNEIAFTLYHIEYANFKVYADAQWLAKLNSEAGQARRKEIEQKLLEIAFSIHMYNPANLNVGDHQQAVYWLPAQDDSPQEQVDEEYHDAEDLDPFEDLRIHKKRSDDSPKVVADDHQYRSDEILAMFVQHMDRFDAIQHLFE